MHFEDVVGHGHQQAFPLIHVYIPQSHRHRKRNSVQEALHEPLDCVDAGVHVVFGEMFLESW